MLNAIVRRAHKRPLHSQAGFTLVELLIVIAILAALAAIVLFNVAGVNTSSRCAAMQTDGATLQSAADLYYNNNAVYPVNPTDKAAPITGDLVDLTKLKTANLLHSSPDTTKETFTYVTSPVGTIHGELNPVVATCKYN
jgi:prepilin-type N-terminal cleavage/methylation domain-containing protein